jgi:hypothetical protein
VLITLQAYQCLPGAHGIPRRNVHSCDATGDTRINPHDTGCGLEPATNGFAAHIVTRRQPPQRYHSPEAEPGNGREDQPAGDSQHFAFQSLELRINRLLPEQ